MLSNLSKNIALFFSKKGVINDKYLAVYTSGYRYILSEIISFILLISISILFQVFVEGITFYCAFILLRHTCGGYHAVTHKKCSILFFAVYTVVLSIIRALELIPFFLEYGYIVQLAVFAFSCCILLKYAPVQNLKINFSNKTLKSKYHRMILLLIFYAAVIVAATLMINNALLIGYSISIAMLVNSISVIAAKNMANTNLSNTAPRVSFRKIFSNIKCSNNKKLLFRYASYMCSFAAIMSIYSFTTYCRGRFYQPEVPDDLYMFINEYKWYFFRYS